MHSRHFHPRLARDLALTTIREYQPGDEQAILTAFHRAFGEVDPGLQQRSLERWRWQYLANPAGSPVMIAVGEDGAVQAQYAAHSREVVIEGGVRRVRVAHCADSFALRAARSLGDNGLFVRTARAFAEAHGGLGDAQQRFMWGFPVPAAQRIGEHSLGYSTLRSQVMLVLESDAPIPACAPASSKAMAGPEYDHFFHQESRGERALGVRDARYLRWRYLEHPELEFTLHEVRDAAGGLEGFSIGRSAVFEGRESWVICDGLARAAARGPLWRAAAEAARAAGGLPVVLILPPWCEDFGALQELGMRVRPTRLLLVGRSFDRRLDLGYWARRWYYTLGDTDLV